MVDLYQPPTALHWVASKRADSVVVTSVSKASTMALIVPLVFLTAVAIAAVRRRLTVVMYVA